MPRSGDRITQDAVVTVVAVTDRKVDRHIDRFTSGQADERAHLRVDRESTSRTRAWCVSKANIRDRSYWSSVYRDSVKTDRVRGQYTVSICSELRNDVDRIDAQNGSNGNRADQEIGRDRRDSSRAILLQRCRGWIVGSANSRIVGQYVVKVVAANGSLIGNLSDTAWQWIVDQHRIGDRHRAGETDRAESDFDFLTASAAVDHGALAGGNRTGNDRRIGVNRIGESNRIGIRIPGGDGDRVLDRVTGIDVAVIVDVIGQRIHQRSGYGRRFDSKSE